MTRLEDEVRVFRLACLTEDLAPAERSAMQRTAERLERRWNRRTVTNREHLAKRGELHGLADLIGSGTDG